MQNKGVINPTKELYSLLTVESSFKYIYNPTTRVSACSQLPLPQNFTSKWSISLAGQLSWLEHHPDTPRLQVRALVRAHRRIKNKCINEWNNKSMFLSLPLPLSLIKKIIVSHEFPDNFALLSKSLLTVSFLIVKCLICTQFVSSRMPQSEKQFGSDCPF